MIKAIATIAFAALGLNGCTSVKQIPNSKVASGILRNANGAPAGSVVLLTAGDQITLNVSAIGLPKGPHGLHLHTTGSCDGPDFKSAGAHLNPHGMQHGSANPAGSHLGDLPNLVADGYGAGTVTTILHDGRSTIEAALFDSDGTAIVVHADPDDYKTDPSGNSGARIACAVLKRG